MKNTKRLLLFLLILLLLFSLVGCGNDNSNSKKIKSMLVNGKLWIKDWKDSLLYRDIYDFHDDNTVIYHDLAYREFDNHLGYSIFTGTYKITDDFIVLEFKTRQDIDTKDYTTVKKEESITQVKNIPYTINEYTKELIFDVDRSGDSIYYCDTGLTHYVKDFPKLFKPRNK